MITEGFAVVMATMPISIDEIFNYASTAIIAVASVILYIIAISEWLPSLLIAKRHGKAEVSDRGLARYSYPEGRSVVYEPTPAYSAIVEKYMLYTVGERKYFKCRFASKVRSAYCELLIYDRHNKLIQTSNVFFNNGDERFCEAFVLPDETSYIGLSVLKVNGKNARRAEKDKKWFERHLLVRRSTFAALTVLITAIEGYILTGLVRFFVDLFMVERFGFGFEVYVGRSGRSFDVMISIAAGILLAALSILAHMRKDRV